MYAGCLEVIRGVNPAGTSKWIPCLAFSQPADVEDNAFYLLLKDNII